MMEHLTDGAMNAMADGELSPEEMAGATAHLANCPECTTGALAKMMLKQTVTQVGRRYTLPDEVRARLNAKSDLKPGVTRYEWKRWAVAAALFIAILGGGLLWRSPSPVEVTLATEVVDQHVATMVASAAPEVLSSDRHTVKPWFQGKIPFSFNVPETLPDATTLDGANLAYIGHRPVAQLLYSIGKHRVSVFVMEKGSPAGRLTTSQVSGFHIVAVQAGGLDIVAISDVEISKLEALTSAIDEAQR